MKNISDIYQKFDIKESPTSLFEASIIKGLGYFVNDLAERCNKYNVTPDIIADKDKIVSMYNQCQNINLDDEKNIIKTLLLERKLKESLEALTRAESYALGQKLDLSVVVRGCIVNGIRHYVNITENILESRNQKIDLSIDKDMKMLRKFVDENDLAYKSSQTLIPPTKSTKMNKEKTQREKVAVVAER